MWYTAAMKRIACLVIIAVVAIGSILAGNSYSQQPQGPARPPASGPSERQRYRYRGRGPLLHASRHGRDRPCQAAGGWDPDGTGGEKAPRPHHPAARKGCRGRDPHLLHQRNGRRVDHENPAQHHGQPRQERRDARRFLQHRVPLGGAGPSFRPALQGPAAARPARSPSIKKTRSPSSTSTSSSTRTPSGTWAWGTSRSRK